MPDGTEPKIYISTKQLLEVLWKAMRDTKHLKEPLRLEEVKRIWKEAIDIKIVIEIKQ